MTDAFQSDKVINNQIKKLEEITSMRNRKWFAILAIIDSHILFNEMELFLGQ